MNDENDRRTGAPQIGSDEWVSRADQLRLQRSRAQRVVDTIEARVPIGARFAFIVAASACLPLATGSDYIVRVGVNTLIYALLALGLNIEIGWVGALDLGYIALFGFGAYLYAFVASDQFHEHWPSILSLPLVMLATALIAAVIGLSSRRLVGDYYAIVTLFFAEAFLTVVTNADRITPPFSNGPVDFTGGPNGILNVDPIRLIGVSLDSVRAQYYFALASAAVIALAIYLANHSRTGRSWRAMKDDTLVAELMGMPTFRLRLLALALAGAIAGLAGSTLATVQVGVFPANFDLSLLITIYAMVIFGGAGNMAGVVAGAIALNVMLEFLRNPDQARLLFYVVIVSVVARLLRPWWLALQVLVATVALGFLLRFVAEQAFPNHVAVAPPGSGTIARGLAHWVIVLDSQVTVGNIGYVTLLMGAVALTRLGRGWRLLALPPVLYLAAFVWENRLADNPAITRLIILGAILVTFMNARPRGLLGTPQVEIA